MSVILERTLNMAWVCDRDSGSSGKVQCRDQVKTIMKLRNHTETCNGSIHSLRSSCYGFLHKYSFGLLQLSPNIRTSTVSKHLFPVIKL
jgi:hypothetical protein